METGNTVMIIVGALLILLGALTIFIPNLSRIINVPGGPKLKAIVSIVIGLILIVVGISVQL
jgi:dipeptide/tripeptide permease